MSKFAASQEDKNISQSLTQSSNDRTEQLSLSVNTVFMDTFKINNAMLN